MSAIFVNLSGSGFASECVADEALVAPRSNVKRCAGKRPPVWRAPRRGAVASRAFFCEA